MADTLKPVPTGTQILVTVDKDGMYRWRLTTPDAGPIADSSEGYATRDACMEGLRRARLELPQAPVVLLG